MQCRINMNVAFLSRCHLHRCHLALPVAVCAEHPPSVCFGSGFSALLAPLAPLALRVYSRVNFAAEISLSPGQQTSTRVIAMLFAGGVSEKKKERKKRDFHIWVHAAGRGIQSTDEPQLLFFFMVNKFIIAHEFNILGPVLLIDANKAKISH